jgi:hypothetical protein
VASVCVSAPVLLGQSTTVVVSGKGTFGSDAPSTEWTAPNGTRQFSFTTANPPSPCGSPSVGFGFVISQFSNFVYYLNGALVNTIPNHMQLYNLSSQGGGWLLDDFDNLNNGFNMVPGVQFYTGPETSPTLTLGTWSASGSHFDFVGASYYTNSGTFSITQQQPLYHLCLLYDPTKAVKSGSTIPVKLQLCDGGGNDVSSPNTVLHATSITQSSTSISGTVQDAGSANPDNDFRFDSNLGSMGGYIFNLSTTGLSTGTYNLNFTVTGDSSMYSTQFQVK